MSHLAVCGSGSFTDVHIARAVDDGNLGRGCEATGGRRRDGRCDRCGLFGYIAFFRLGDRFQVVLPDKGLFGAELDLIPAAGLPNDLVLAAVWRVSDGLGCSGRFLADIDAALAVIYDAPA